MGYISILLLSFFISLGFSIFIIPRILLISFKKHLFDMPDERKVHKGIIPRLGGVSFFPAVIFTLSLMIGLNRIYGEELFPLLSEWVIRPFYLLGWVVYCCCIWQVLPMTWSEFAIVRNLLFKYSVPFCWCLRDYGSIIFMESSEFMNYLR